jgi:hypothetical protein
VIWLSLASFNAASISTASFWGVDLNTAAQLAQVVVAAFTVLAILVALWAIFSQNRAARFSATVDNLWRFDDQFHGPEKVRQRATAAKALQTGKHVPEIVDVMNFFDFAGLMVRKGALDADAANSSFGYWAIRYWYLCQARVAEDRRTAHYDWQDFDHLRKKCERLEAAKRRRMNKKRIKPSGEDLKNFLEEEAGLRVVVSPL